ncbi:hypothetical protein BDZ91DRAFT_135565 [Kalaharituber pfeilii]|nr:hypothetical protein BDZ91DRAFT_135565 [Kalaharituber pfeilii]
MWYHHHCLSSFFIPLDLSGTNKLHFICLHIQHYLFLFLEFFFFFWWGHCYFSFQMSCWVVVFVLSLRSCG